MEDDKWGGKVTSGNEHSQSDVYMSGALSDLSPEEYERVTTQIYNRVAQVCKAMDLDCYCPHASSTTPTKGMPHSKVWQTDYARVVNSGTVVAYIGIPALGVGAEIEMARTANVPVILLCESSKQEKLSRLILGSPAVEDIVFFDDDPSEFEERLRRTLVYVFSKRNLDDVAYEDEWSHARFRRLEQVLEDTMAKEDKHRSFPAAPISKRQWREMPEEASPDSLFDD